MESESEIEIREQVREEMEKYKRKWFVDILSQHYHIIGVLIFMSQWWIMHEYGFSFFQKFTYCMGGPYLCLLLAYFYWKSGIGFRVSEAEIDRALFTSSNGIPALETTASKQRSSRRDRGKTIANSIETKDSDSDSDQQSHSENHSEDQADGHLLDGDEIKSGIRKRRKEHC